MHHLGIFVEPVRSSDELVRTLQRRTPSFDAVIADSRRENDPVQGLGLLDVLPPNHPPVIFYVSSVDRSRGVPAGLFGITNRPDEV